MIAFMEEQVSMFLGVLEESQRIKCVGCLVGVCEAKKKAVVSWCLAVQEKGKVAVARKGFIPVECDPSVQVLVDSGRTHPSHECFWTKNIVHSSRR